MAWSPPGGPECAATDVVACTTDERGRFVGKLLPQESYSAWAIGIGPDGSPRASAGKRADPCALGSVQIPVVAKLELGDLGVQFARGEVDLQADLY